MRPTIPTQISILIEACDAFGYEYKMLDETSNNLLRVSDGKKYFYASNSRVGVFPLNFNYASQVAMDKAWTYRVLEDHHVATPRGEYFFTGNYLRPLRGDGHELEDACHFAKKIGYPVFVKQNNSTFGLYADVVYSEEELKAQLRLIQQKSHIAIIQEVLDQPEYRLIVIDGKVECMYRVRAPRITGDGIHTIKELICAKNETLKRNTLHIAADSHYMKHALQVKGYTLGTVLETGTVFKVSDTNNLACGGEFCEYSETIPVPISDIAKNVFKAMNLRVMGIDLFYENNIGIVIEVNHNPGFAGLYQAGYIEKTMDLWHKVLVRYFTENI